MNFAELSIRRPVLIIMLNLALVLTGLVSLSRLPVRELPDIDPPIVNVQTVYLGASAAVVETEITERLEEAINGVDGIKTLSSESREQVSNITVEFTLARDIDQAAQDVRDRVARVRGDLPDDIEEPIVSKQDSDARPMMWVALNSDIYSTRELSDLAENIFKDYFQTVSGVSAVVVGGQKRFAVRLRLDPLKMAAHGVTALDLQRALLEQNVELPSGRIENLSRELVIQVMGEFPGAEDFNQLVISRSGDTLVRFQDIGVAEGGVEDERSLVRYNSKPSVGLGIVKQSKANTIQVAAGIKRELARQAGRLPAGVDVFVAYDESVYVQRSIADVWKTLFGAFVLVVAVIFLFLGSARSTIVPAIAIPVSTAATFAVMYYMDYSINIVTMLGLVLAIGVVVDDSIVVLENIYRHIEGGESPRQAALTAVSEIMFAVLATTIALVAVFLPLAFQTTITGRLFVEFAVAMSGAVVISSFVALTLTPLVASRILRSAGSEIRPSLLIRFEALLSRINARYQAVLAWALNHRLLVISAAVVGLLATAGFFGALEREFLPAEDTGRMIAFAIAPEGATPEYTDRMLRKMEAIVAETPEVAGYFSGVALPFSGPGKGNEGLIFIRLEERRSRSISDVIGGPNGFGARFFREVQGAFAIPIVPKALGGGFGQPFQLVLQQQELSGLQSTADDVVKRLQASGYLANVRSNFALTKPELFITIDRNRAAALGVPVSDIARTLDIFFGGRRLSKISIAGEEYQVIAQAPRSKRLTPAALDRIFVRGAEGQQIHLSSIVSSTVRAAPNAIFHHDRLRSAVIEGTPVGVPLGTAMMRAEEILDEHLPQGVSYTWSGESEDLKESGGEAFFVLALALLVIYMTLAAQFESLVHPFTVMLALPLGALGAFGGLWLFGRVNFLGEILYGWANYAPDPPLIAGVLSAIVPRIPSMTVNLFSLIGVLLLFGLVTKNSILLVDFANKARARGESARAAIVAAGAIRLRPILMTAVSTIIAILPIAIGFGTGAESRRPLGVAVVCGMLVSTVLTLVVVPVVYTVLDDLAEWRRRRDVGAKITR